MADPASKARPVQVSWLLPPGLTINEACAALVRSRPCHEEPSRSVSQTWLDSFDWRLHRRGWVLLHEASASEFEFLELWTSENAQPIRATAGLPSGPGDLSASRLRETIAPVLGVRCLVACATAITTRRTLRVLNDDAKTVAWTHFEASTGLGGVTLGNRVRVVALRGYEQAARDVDRWLATGLGLEVTTGVMAEALAGAGRSAGDYSSKLNVALSPGMSIEAAVRKVLAHLLANVETNTDGARANLDPEFLHDIRVATRRARSLLGEAGPYLADAGAAGALRAELAWLGEVTGPTRDLDVWLVTLDEELAGSPPVQADLGALREQIDIRRRAAYDQLVDQLDSDRYRALRDLWASLASPDTPAGIRAGAAGAELVRRAHRRVLRRGSAIGADSPDEALHDLRKAAKRLRYVLESFESLCPEAAFDQVIGELKALQDNLGEFQDCSVQAATLARLGSEPDTPPQALVAVGYLLAGLGARHTRARAEFADRFARFSRPSARRLVDSLASSLEKTREGSVK